MGWHHLEKMGLYLPPSFESQQIQNLAKCPSLGQNGSTWSVNQNVLVCTKQRLNMSWFCKYIVKNEPTLTQSLQDPFFSDIFSYFCYFLPVTPKIQRPDINGNYQARKVCSVNAQSKMSQHWCSPCKIRFFLIFSAVFVIFYQLRQKSNVRT